MAGIHYAHWQLRGRLATGQPLESGGQTAGSMQVSGASGITSHQFLVSRPAFSSFISAPDAHGSYPVHSGYTLASGNP